MSMRNASNPVLKGFTPTVSGVPGAGVGMTTIMSRSAALFLIVLAAAGVTITLVPAHLIGAVTTGAALAALVLGLVMTFSRKASMPLVFLFTVLDGVLVGGMSYMFEGLYHGIVPLALGATVCTALAITVGQAMGFLRTTPGLLKFVAYATIGYMIFWLVTILLGLMGVHLFTLGSPISIAVSVFGTFLATYSFLRDVEQVREAARYDVSSRDGWFLAFSLVTTLVWLYIELLRLIANVMAFNR